MEISYTLLLNISLVSKQCHLKHYQLERFDEESNAKKLGEAISLQVAEFAHVEYEAGTIYTVKLLTFYISPIFRLPVPNDLNSQMFHFRSIVDEIQQPTMTTNSANV